jgi:hypothetical protein
MGICGTVCFSNKYIAGGPLLPNISITTRLPVLQQGHFSAIKSPNVINVGTRLGACF